MKHILTILLTLLVLSNSSFTMENTNNYFNVKQQADEFFKEKGNLKPGNNWMKRWLWDNRMNFNSNGDLFDLSYPEDYKEKDKKNNNILSQNSWTPLGPIEFPPTYEPRSCYGMGRVNCIAFHPTNKDIFWVGTPGGGIWKTENSGKSWIPLTDNLATLATSSIAVNQKEPNILYAATGDYDASGMTSSNARGVIKSTDGGNSWTFTGLSKNPTYGSSTLRKVIIHSDSSNTLVAAGRRGIWKSTDGGENWLTMCDSIITDLEVNPSNPNILYAAMGQLYGAGSAGFLKSTDFGNSWIAIETGIPAKGQIGRVELAVTPADPNYIYALAVKSSNNGFHSFYQSTDAGKTWKTNAILDSTNNILGAWGGDKSDNYGQASYDLVLIADPLDKYKVYSGGINIWMSENSGKDWEIASFWIYVFGKSIHADHHYAAYNPLDYSFYFCNDGGVYRTKLIQPGSKDWINKWIDKSEENLKPGAPTYNFPTQWENLSSGLAITEFYRLTLSKNTNNILAGGSQDNSCYYYNAGNWLNYIPNYDGMETMIDYDNPDIFYGVWQYGGLCKTTDGGKTIKTGVASSTNESGLWITPVAMDPYYSNTIYIGYNSLWRSSNGGDKWTKVLNFDSTLFKSKNSNSISIIKNAYNSSDYLAVYRDIGWYYDTSKVWKKVPGELWITKDACKTWKNSLQNLPIDSINIISIEFDRKNPEKIWLALYSSIREINTYLSTDGGDSWKDVSKPLPNGSLRINAIVCPPSSTNAIYAGTNYGVYFCDDNTDKWIPFSENLPNVNVRDLEISEKTREIFAGTYGRGVWKTQLLVDDVVEANNKLSIEVFPNPLSESFIIKLDSKEEIRTNVDLKIIDINGISVYKEEFTAIDINLTKAVKPNLISGVYFLILKMNDKTYSNKLIIKK